MDRFDMAVGLILEAQAEKQRLEKMNAEMEKVKAKNPDYGWIDLIEVEQKYSPTPRKSVVNENIKMARRLLMLERLT